MALLALGGCGLSGGDGGAERADEEGPVDLTLHSGRIGPLIGPAIELYEEQSGHNVEEAEQIVFEGVVPKQRPRDAHARSSSVRVAAGGVMGYRGLVRKGHNSQGSKSHVQCDGLMMDPYSRSDTWPDIQIQNPHVTVAHEALVGKISDEQMFYLQSRGLSEEEAAAMIVNGFIEPVTKELPMEYAVELNRLIQLEMTGSIG